MPLKIKYLGHSSFLININKKNILTDPFFSAEKEGKHKRVLCCGLTPQEIKKVDTILISHEHFDNFDIEGTNFLAKKFQPKIIAHQSVLNDINCSPYHKVAVDEYDSKTINDITYKAFPAHHPTSFYPLSYLINHKNKSVYFAGDTYMTKEHEKITADVALLPIEGKTTMDMGTAARVAKKIRPKVLIPMKYNTFEHIKQNPQVLKEKLDKTRYNIETVILNPGKHYTLK